MSQRRTFDDRALRSDLFYIESVLLEHELFAFAVRRSKMAIVSESQVQWSIHGAPSREGVSPTTNVLVYVCYSWRKWEFVKVSVFNTALPPMHSIEVISYKNKWAAFDVRAIIIFSRTSGDWVVVVILIVLSWFYHKRLIRNQTHLLNNKTNNNIGNT